MTTIASLRVALEADTSKFRSAMTAATDGVKRFALAGAAVAASGAALVKSGLDSADQLQKLSLRTGVSVEALSALRHAANLSDVSVQSLERGFSQLNKSIGEAEQGTAAQAEAFESLNIDLATLKKLKPEQQFALIADRLNGLNDEAKAAALGNDIFGGSYRKLLPLIKSGSAGMQQAADEAQKLGLVLSKDQADAAAKANDSLATLQGTISALSQAFAVELAPGISTALQALTQNLPGIIASVKAAFVGVGTGIGGVAFAASQVFTGDFSGAASTIGGLGADMDAAVQAELDKVSENTGEQVRILTDIRDAVQNNGATVQ